MNSVVIVRYDEPLDWVKDIPEDFDVYVYNAGSQINDGSILDRIDFIVSLDSAASVSEAWLEHILETGGETEGFVVFTTADPLRHDPGFLSQLKNWRQWGPLRAFAGQAAAGRFSLDTWQATGAPDEEGARIGREYRETNGNLSSGTNIAAHFLDAAGFSAIAGKARRNTAGTFAPGGIFAAARELLPDLPAGAVEKLRGLVRGSALNGAVLERLWLHILGAGFDGAATSSPPPAAVAQPAPAASPFAAPQAVEDAASPWPVASAASRIVAAPAQAAVARPAPSFAPSDSPFAPAAAAAPAAPVPQAADTGEAASPWPSAIAPAASPAPAARPAHQANVVQISTRPAQVSSRPKRLFISTGYFASAMAATIARQQETPADNYLLIIIDRQAETGNRRWAHQVNESWCEIRTTGHMGYFEDNHGFRNPFGVDFDEVYSSHFHIHDFIVSKFPARKYSYYEEGLTTYFQAHGFPSENENIRFHALAPRLMTGADIFTVPIDAELFRETLARTAACYNVPYFEGDRNVVLLGHGLPPNIAKERAGTLEYFEPLTRALGSAGFNVWFRPHPRVATDDIFPRSGLAAAGARLLDTDCPLIESVILQNRTQIAAVVSVYSSLLVHSLPLFGIPAFTIPGRLQDNHQQDWKRLQDIFVPEAAALVASLPDGIKAAARAFHNGRVTSLARHPVLQQKR